MSFTTIKTDKPVFKIEQEGENFYAVYPIYGSLKGHIMHMRKTLMPYFDYNVIKPEYCYYGRQYKGADVKEDLIAIHAKCLYPSILNTPLRLREGAFLHLGLSHSKILTLTKLRMFLEATNIPEAEMIGLAIKYNVALKDMLYVVFSAITSLYSPKTENLILSANPEAVSFKHEDTTISITSSSMKLGNEKAFLVNINASSPLFPLLLSL